MTMRTEQPLATFVDRHTVVYERTYPHPIRRVWDAVSTGEHLNAWMLPEVRVERRLGGSYAFGWGGSCDVPEATHGTLTVYDPPSAIQFMTADGSFMRFDLAARGDTTHLLFTLHFLPPVDNEPVDGDPGGDLPAGTGAAWRPGFMVGYHHMVDRLDAFLRGEWTLADNERDLARFVADGWDAADLELIEVYRRHIATECPSA